ncbi:MAG: hypothetical protein COT84_07860 [Chlamydiae bacterium CG10_big_fil_rev_8_21_14_0_10_35_9]|nr:MAG: hypothetical protein COT84_07860 [Chlamydiae bacterium CG10_big_fil_rev_8_21_14_0_10_35_9]
MSAIRRIPIFLSLLFLLCCQSSQDKSHTRIGMDPGLPSMEFSPMLPYVTGFLKDFFLKVSATYHISFEQIYDSRQDLLTNLDQEKYEGILSSTYPLNFYLDKYAFSDVIIPFGPVLVAKSEGSIDSVHDLKNKIVAVQKSDMAKLDLSSYQCANIKIYTSILQSLNDVLNNKVDAAFVKYIPAISFVEDTFYQKLKIASAPLNDRGLRFITLKENSNLIDKFNATFQKMKKKSSLEKLLMKWGVRIDHE